MGKLLSVTDGSGVDVSSNASHVGNINPLRYRGYYYDSETGLYYLNSRYYDPETGRFINADDQLNTGAGLFGNNLFAYCLNNPINNVDSDGHLALTLSSIFGNLWNPVGWIAAVAVVAVVVIAVVVADKVADVVTDVVENVENITNTKDQSVYTLTDPDDNKVKYVGRTNNPTRREKEHKKNPAKAKYKMKIVATGLNKPEAKIMEQTLISAYTLDYLDNARREIAVGNLAGYKDNMDAVIKIFGSITEDELMNLMGR